MAEIAAGSALPGKRHDGDRDTVGTTTGDLDGELGEGSLGEEREHQR